MVLMRVSAGKPRAVPKFVAGATALYAQLASVLRSRILSGEWEAGADIPTIDELCAAYGLGRITVRQAINILAGEGLLSSQRGRRAFVTYTPVNPEAEPLFASLAAVETQSPEYSIRVLARARVDELPVPRWMIGVSSGPYMSISKVDHTGGKPYALSNICVAEDIYKRFPKGAENRSKLLRLVVKYSRVAVTQARERVSVAAADYAEAHALGCPMAAPVARTERVFCDDSGCVVYYAKTTYHGDLYRMDRDVSDYLRGM